MRYLYSISFHIESSAVKLAMIQYIKYNVALDFQNKVCWHFAYDDVWQHMTFGISLALSNERSLVSVIKKKKKCTVWKRSYFVLK